MNYFVVYYNQDKEREIITMTVSKHYTNDRQEREQLIQQIGNGQIVKRVFTDKAFYAISSTGIVTIMNNKTFKVITRIIARPNQLRKLYAVHSEIVPKYLINQAIHHVNCGYNEI